MKTILLSQLLSSDLNDPLAFLNPRTADGAARWNGVAPRLRPGLADGIDVARVLATQAEIEAGRYAPDPDEVAEGVLATIAPTRRH